MYRGASGKLRKGVNPKSTTIQRSSEEENTLNEMLKTLMERRSCRTVSPEVSEAPLRNSLTR